LRSLSDLYARALDSPELIPPAAPQPPFDNQIRRTLDQPPFERPAVRTAPTPLLTAVFSLGGFRTPAHLVDSKSAARQDPQCAGPVAKRILDCDQHFRHRCLLRALGYRLGARPIQGHALPSGGVSGHYWWRAGADRGNPDRRILIRQLHSNVTEVALGGSRGASRRTPRNSAWRAPSCGSALGC
jgi:hypothetical protein